VIVTDLIEWCLRAFGLLLALVLLSAALFMLPDDQQQAQSRLENWWQHMRDEVKGKAQSFILAFIHQTASSATRGFNWLFGDLFSARFFIVSGLLSTGSFLVGMWFYGDYGWAVPSGILIFAVGTAWLAFVGKQISDDLDKISDPRNRPFDRLDIINNGNSRSSLFDQSYASFERPKSWWEDALEAFKKEAPAYIPMIVIGSSGTLVFNEALDKGIDGWVFGSAIFVSFVCDIIAIGFTMVALEKISRVTSGIAASGWLFVDACVAVTMVGGPWLLFVYLGSGGTPFQVFLLFVAAANLSTALPAIFYILIAVTLLLHRMLWTILLRPFYIYFINSKLLHNRKLQGSSGLTLLGISWPGLFEEVEPFVKQFMTLLG